MGALRIIKTTGEDDNLSRVPTGEFANIGQGFMHFGAADFNKPADTVAAPRNEFKFDTRPGPAFN